MAPSSSTAVEENAPSVVSPWLLILIQAAVFMVAAEARVIAPLLPAIGNDFAVTSATAGLLVTAYSLPYGLFQLVYGPLADRFSRQRVMGAALSLFALGTLVSGFAPNFSWLNWLRLGTGAAAAGVIPVALAYVGDAVPYAQRQGALGRVISMASLGGLLSAALGGVIATIASWRVLFVGYGILALLVAAVLLRLPVVAPTTRSERPPGLLGPYRAVFNAAGKSAWALYALVFYEGLVATSTQSYLGAMLYDRHQLSYGIIGALLTLSGVANVLAARSAGRLVARFNERGMVLLGGVLMTAAYLLVGLQPWQFFFPLAMLLMGAGFVIAHSTLQTRATELVPSLRGTAVALFAFSLFMGGGLGTFFASLVIDSFGYAVALAATAVSLAFFTAVAGPLLKQRS